MKLESYWIQTSQPVKTVEQSLPARSDVVIVGGGFTGLSAALAFARKGAQVVLLEAGDLVGEASGRNGGHVNNGIAVDYGALADRVGVETASGWYRAYDAAVDTVEHLVKQEQIDCDFLRHGKLKLASRPAHFDALIRSYERISREVDPDVELFNASEISRETSSNAFYGGLLQRRSAQMHVARFGTGLAQAAQRHGALLQTHTPVVKLERIGQTHTHRVYTERGTIQADQVLVATGTTRHGSYSTFGWWRRRIVPIGSFIIVTEPLSEQIANSLFAGRRTYTTTANLHHYFRLTPDNRLVFGGRARFAMSSPTSDEKSGRILHQSMVAVFPQLVNVRVDYCWGGLVDMTQDRLPHAGEKDGLYYSMGYSGHGVQMSTHMGQIMSRVMSGEVNANPWRNHPWPAIPGHVGPPWFLPAIGLYYRIKDAVS